MLADFDSKANAVSIVLSSDARAERAEQIHSRAIIGLRGDRPIELQLLYPDLGIEEPLAAVVRAYDLDREALAAAITAALAAPDRPVTLDVAMRSVA